MEPKERENFVNKLVANHRFAPQYNLLGFADISKEAIGGQILLIFRQNIWNYFFRWFNFQR